MAQDKPRMQYDSTNKQYTLTKTNVGPIYTASFPTSDKVALGDIKLDLTFKNYTLKSPSSANVTTSISPTLSFAPQKITIANNKIENEVKLNNNSEGLFLDNTQTYTHTYTMNSKNVSFKLNSVTTLPGNINYLHNIFDI